MELIKAYGKEIISLLIPIFTLALNHIFRAKAKLHFSTPHQFTFLVKEPLKDPNGDEIKPSQVVYTKSLLIRNAGKLTVTGLEIVFNWKPMYMNIWIPRHFEDQIESDDRYIVKFDSLAPGEFFNMELLSINNELPDTLAVRSEQCVAENIAMYPQPLVARWKQRIAVVLLFAGLALSVYLFILLMQFVLLQTPLGFKG